MFALNNDKDQGKKFAYAFTFFGADRVHLYWRESDITSRWVHRACSLKFTLSSNRNQKKIRFTFPQRK